MPRRTLAMAPEWLPVGCPDVYNGAPGVFVVDEIGTGKGGSDRLAEIGFDVQLFNSARRPRHENALCSTPTRGRTSPPISASI